MPRIDNLKLAFIGCVVLGATAVAPMAAGARDVDMYDSKVKIANSPPAFHGKVESDYGPCKNNRHVAVFRKRNGDDQKLGGDTTGPAGRWQVGAGMLSSGAYYARVRAKQQIVSGNGYTCSKDKSKTLVVD